ncbi:hypothetical protein Tco_0046606 [Tanacetum coccineum]
MPHGTYLSRQFCDILLPYLNDAMFNKIVPMYDESAAFIIQNHVLKDFCKITLRRQDGYMLVKDEKGSKLCVIDETTKVKTYLPSPPSKSTNETFTMLYDGREGKEEHKIIHVWLMSREECVIGSSASSVGGGVL